MSNRNNRKTGKGIYANPKPDEYNIPEDFTLPNCSIEDVDRSLFELFNKDLPFFFKHKQGMKRAPVIFASGERFAVLRRKRPLRDKSGVLILPLISIMRTAITQSPSIGAGTNQNQRVIVKQRLSDKDPDYQRIINRPGLSNSEDLAIKSVAATSVSPIDNENKNRDPDQSKLNSSQLRTRENNPVTLGTDLRPDISKNIFEVISMAPPKYYTARYEVTFWAQYTTQMNDMLMALMALYQSYAQRSFRLETPKGYWFVGYVEDDLAAGNNFDNFSDDERLVRYSFNLFIPAYIIGSPYPGGQSTLRRTLSAPIVEFGIETSIPSSALNPRNTFASGQPKDYILDDLRTGEDEKPQQRIPKSTDKSTAFVEQENAVTGSQSIGGRDF